MQEFTNQRPLNTKRSDFFSVKIWRNSLGYSRFGIVISKKVDKRAVYRNKIKRIIFDFIRLNEIYKEGGKDILIIVNPKIQEIEKEQMEKELKNNL